VLTRSPIGDSDPELQPSTLDNVPPHAAAIRLLEAVSALVYGRTVTHDNANIRGGIELEEQRNRS
jgi:hypothetical protein